MDSDDPLADAIAVWQRKYRVADGDPMIAALELVRLYLQHARPRDDNTDSSPPSFEDFRGTIETLDLRAKSFINQAVDLLAELRRFGQNIQSLNRRRWLTQFALTASGGLAGFLIGRLL